MNWVEYYRQRLERLEQSGLKKYLTWDRTCDYFFYAMSAKQYADEYVLPNSELEEK